MSGDDDLLERATRALRATPPPSDEELRIERAVLLRAHRAAAQKRRGRGRTLRWVLPLAAVLTAGSALAATTGQIERAVAAVSAWLEREPAPAKAPRTAKRSGARKASAPKPDDAPSAPPAEPTVAAPEAAEPEVVEPDARDDANAATPPRSPVAPARAARSDAPRRTRAADAPPVAVEQLAERDTAAAPDASLQPAAPAPNPDLMRYREAHRLHFRERDMWAALKAWESYLSTYPNGTFAIEARYNRAICLVRLGRNEEARRALAPFAAGEVGRAYRKAEASALLRALE